MAAATKLRVASGSTIGSAGRKLDQAHLRARVQRDVLGNVEGLEAAVLRVPGHRDHAVGVDTVDARVVTDPELHRVPSAHVRPGYPAI